MMSYWPQKRQKRLGVSSGVKWCQVLWRSVNCCQGVSRMLFTLRALLFVQLLVNCGKNQDIARICSSNALVNCSVAHLPELPSCTRVGIRDNYIHLDTHERNRTSMQWIGCRGIKEHQPPASATPRTEFMAETPSSTRRAAFGDLAWSAVSRLRSSHQHTRMWAIEARNESQFKKPPLPNLNMSTELRTSDGMSSKAISTNILGFQGWESWMKPTKSSSFVGRQQKMKNNPGLFAKVTPEKLTSEWSSVIKRKVPINFHKWRRTTMIKPKMQAIAKKRCPNSSDSSISPQTAHMWVNAKWVLMLLTKKKMSVTKSVVPHAQMKKSFP